MGVFYVSMGMTSAVGCDPNLNTDDKAWRVADFKFTRAWFKVRKGWILPPSMLSVHFFFFQRIATVFTSSPEYSTRSAAELIASIQRPNAFFLIQALTSPSNLIISPTVAQPSYEEYIPQNVGQKSLEIAAD